MKNKSRILLRSSTLANRQDERDKGQRLFTVTEFLSVEQVASFFSRLAAKGRHQKATITEEDVCAAVEEALKNFEEARKKIMTYLNLQHPIIVDQYNREQESYGIDFDRMVSESSESNSIVVPTTECPLSEEALTELKRSINPKLQSVNRGVDIYLNTVAFVTEHVSQGSQEAQESQATGQNCCFNGTY
ncbi:hypothetical protein QZH41_020726 [Actinostola sp. cb2023]|nr:hypothetical protein QZH41_020726 [Actinostola sp. cb2023]